MYNTIDSVPRADISTVLMEAVDQEKQYIGQLVYPVFPSGKEVGRYPKFRIGAAELLKKYGSSTKRNETGTYNETDRKFEWDSYQTEEYGLEERVDDVVARRMESFFDAEVVTGKYLMNQLMLDYEQQVSDILMNESNFTGTNTSQLYTEANTAGSTPFDVPADVNGALERFSDLGETPNCMIVSLKVWNRMRRSQKLQTYVYGFLNVTQGGSQITEQMFAQVFGLQQILIARKSVDTANKGKTPVISPIWGTDFIAVAKLGQGDFMNGGVGRTIIWDADAPGGLWTSESYRDEKRRGNMLRVRSNRVLKTVSPNCVQLLDCGFDGSFVS